MSTSSLLPAVRSTAADCQAHQLIVSSSYLQRCRGRVFVAQQQKRSVFQQRNASDVGDLVYKNSKRYHYFLTYVVTGVTVVCVVINSALLRSGYKLAASAEFDEETIYTFMNMALAFSTMFYLLTLALLSRTVFYIYYNESTRRFLGVCYSWRMARKNLVFNPGEVQLVEDNSRFRQFFCGSYKIDNQPYHISARDFITPRHYNLMLGFLKE